MGTDGFRVTDTVTVKMSRHWEMTSSGYLTHHYKDVQVLKLTVFRWTISGYLTHHYKDGQVLKLTIFRCLCLCNGGIMGQGS